MTWKLNRACTATTANELGIGQVGIARIPQTDVIIAARLDTVQRTVEGRRGIRTKINAKTKGRGRLPTR
jgi:hypothetical protein